MVSSFLKCNSTTTESWIVNFIRLSNIEAKIDSENGIINIIKKQNYFDENVNSIHRHPSFSPNEPFRLDF